jgi:hypothetical protein
MDNERPDGMADPKKVTSPTPQSEQLSDNQLGRGDVDEANEKLEEIGAGYSQIGGPRANPFYVHRGMETKRTFTEEPQTEAGQLVVHEESKGNEQLERQGRYFLDQLKETMELFLEAESDEVKKAAGDDISKISQKILALEGFISSDLFQEYLSIKKPYLDFIDRETAKITAARDEAELNRLRRGLS